MSTVTATNIARQLSVFSLEGKTALITGASSGIGRHMAVTLSKAGAHVIVVARRVDQLESLVNQIKQDGGKADAVKLDVTRAESINACFDAIEKLVGAPDIIVSNAGTTVGKPALQQTEDDWDFVLNTNLKGCWMINTEAARRLLKHKKGGSIINIASILGERVAGAVAPYSASKAGVIQMTKSLALEFARYGIRVNAILPGYVMTDLNSEFLTSEAGKRLESRVPFRRFGQMDDMDGPLLLLASEAGHAMTGTAIPVDWGHLVSSL